MWALFLLFVIFAKYSKKNTSAIQAILICYWFPKSNIAFLTIKKFSLTSKEKYAIIKENGMSVKFYDGSNFDENNGYYRLC